METKSRNKGFFAVLSPKSHTCLHGMEEFCFFKCWVKYPNCLPFANERETFRCTPLPVTNRIGSGSRYILTFHCHLGGLTSKWIHNLFWLLTPWSNTIIQEWWMWKLAIVKTFLHPWPHPEPWILEREYQVLVFFPWISSDFFQPCQGYERQLTPNEAVVSGVCVSKREPVDIPLNLSRTGRTLMNACTVDDLWALLWPVSWIGPISAIMILFPRLLRLFWVNDGSPGVTLSWDC